jgi:hypothetical protein
MPTGWRGIQDPRWDADAAHLENLIRTAINLLGDVQKEGGDVLVAAAQAERWRMEWQEDLEMLSYWFAGFRQARRYVALRRSLENDGELHRAIFGAVIFHGLS